MVISQILSRVIQCYREYRYFYSRHCPRFPTCLCYNHGHTINHISEVIHGGTENTRTNPEIEQELQAIEAKQVLLENQVYYHRRMQTQAEQGLVELEERKREIKALHTSFDEEWQQ